MCILTMKSMTNALRAKSVLEARGLPVTVVSLDPKLTQRGCAYGIRVPCKDADAAESMLAAKNVSFGIWLGKREVLGK